MSVTILEALRNAEINLTKPRSHLIQAIGLDQLHNAIALLDKGYGPVENVPEKEEEG